MKLETTIELVDGEQPLIRLQAIEVFDDGSGAHALFTVNSGHFSCSSFPFYFDNLERFCRDIPRLYHDLKGKARLSHTYEQGFLEVEMASLGHVTVRGEVAECGEHQQRLAFSFMIDQSYLPSLAKSVQSAIQELEAANHGSQPTLDPGRATDGK